MDKVLKDTMFRELRDKLKELEAIIDKYDASEEVIHTTCIAMPEEDGGTDWSVMYAWNYKNVDDLDDMLTLQAEAYIAEETAKGNGGGCTDNLLNGLFLN